MDCDFQGLGISALGGISVWNVGSVRLIYYISVMFLQITIYLASVEFPLFSLFSIRLYNGYEDEISTNSY